MPSVKEISRSGDMTETKPSDYEINTVLKYFNHHKNQTLHYDDLRRHIDLPHRRLQVVLTFLKNEKIITGIQGNQYRLLHLKDQSKLALETIAALTGKDDTQIQPATAPQPPVITKYDGPGGILELTYEFVVENPGSNSTGLANFCEISQGYASANLGILFKKGYLDRINVVEGVNRPAYNYYAAGTGPEGAEHNADPKAPLSAKKSQPKPLTATIVTTHAPAKSREDAQRIEEEIAAAARLKAKTPKKDATKPLTTAEKKKAEKAGEQQPQTSNKFDMVHNLQTSPEFQYFRNLSLNNILERSLTSHLSEADVQLLRIALGLVKAEAS